MSRMHLLLVVLIVVLLAILVLQGLQRVRSLRSLTTERYIDKSVGYFQKNGWMARNGDRPDPLRWFFGTQRMCVSVTDSTDATLFFYHTMNDNYVQLFQLDVEKMNLLDDRQLWQLAGVTSVMSEHPGDIYIDIPEIAVPCKQNSFFQPIPNSQPIRCYDRPAQSGLAGARDVVFYMQASPHNSLAYFLDVTTFSKAGVFWSNVDSYLVPYLWNGGNSLISVTEDTFSATYGWIPDIAGNFSRVWNE